MGRKEAGIGQGVMPESGNIEESYFIEGGDDSADTEAQWSFSKTLKEKAVSLDRSDYEHLRPEDLESVSYDNLFAILLPQGKRQDSKSMFVLDGVAFTPREYKMVPISADGMAERIQSRAFDAETEEPETFEEKVDRARRAGIHSLEAVINGRELQDGTWSPGAKELLAELKEQRAQIVEILGERVNHLNLRREKGRDFLNLVDSAWPAFLENMLDTAGRNCQWNNEQYARAKSAMEWRLLLDSDRIEYWGSITNLARMHNISRYTVIKNRINEAQRQIDALQEERKLAGYAE